MPKPRRTERHGGSLGRDRTGDVRTFKPYKWGGTPGPVIGDPAVRAPRRETLAELAGPGPDDVSYESRREQLLELDDNLPPAPPPPALPPLPVPVKPVEPPAPRCRVCRYLTTSAGHRVNCT